MLSAGTIAMLLLAVHSATADAPAADLFVQRVSAACLEGASQSVSQSVVDLSGQLTALAALPAALQQLRDSQKQLQTQLTAVEKKLTAPPRPDRQCPSGWTRSGDSCFLVPSEKTSWNMAHGACARLDNRSRLGSMHADTAAVIRALSPGNVWIGLRHLSSSSPWLWADGTDLDYTNWDRRMNQPDNGGGKFTELCALIDYRSPRGWHDYPCTGRHKYLCEIDLH